MINDTARFLARMILFITAALIASTFLYSTLIEAFISNAALNGLIFGVLFVGIILNFRQVLVLKPEIIWLQSLQAGIGQETTEQPADNPSKINKRPVLLSALANMISESEKKTAKFSIDTQVLGTVLDGISSRLEESRDLARYFVGLSIFLGLLGTFWGLLGTVASVGDVIKNLSITGDEIALVFSELKAGLEAPLNGMGTAFSSSLFGLAGSLVLGFLDLQASQAQNSFFNQVENYLSSVTKIKSNNGELGQGISAYTEALLEQTAESLNELQRTLSRGEESRIAANNNIIIMNEKLALLTEQMKTEQQVILKVATNQRDITAFLEKISALSAELVNAKMETVDDATKHHISSIDTTLNRLSGELNTGREQIVKDMRAEIKLVAKMILATSKQSESVKR
tara:strand:- start:209 stop:1408 length:1200 start_codon:yes stop_codon:yes gene_type:complete